MIKAKFYLSKCDIYRVSKSRIQTSKRKECVLDLYIINKNGRYGAIVYERSSDRERVPDSDRYPETRGHMPDQKEYPISMSGNGYCVESNGEIRHFATISDRWTLGDARLEMYK